MRVRGKPQFPTQAFERRQLSPSDRELPQKAAPRRGELILQDGRVTGCGLEDARQEVTDDRTAEACREESPDDLDPADVHRREDAMSRAGSLRVQQALGLVVAQRPFTDATASR
jgi:hypothetical protein